ncbi:Peptidase family M20/M25/M40/Peptidase dimerisation domain containing protein, putative [Leishmania lindenbergi]|uniref:Peptidase family M20/M25/M40/Peptidase dimerization domain containing protein n=1 Tax=Leishmania lindenbergi TaxID=651832 RepID=A0AAW3A3I8_9TRYP
MPAIDREQLDHRVEQIYDQVVAWRRYLHANPDLSYEEQPTAAYIMCELQKMDAGGKWLHISQPEGNCIVSDLKGGAGEGAIVALRADIDALPVEELTDVPFASKKRGVMHACGHDTHAAMLLGATKLLLEDAEKIKGTVRLLFQPAEEVPPGGAKMMIEKGCMEGVTMAFGQHILPLEEVPTGTVLVRKGAILRSSDTLHAEIIGRGGHASLPERSIDPIPIACLAVTALQQVVSRRMPPCKCPVLTISAINSSCDTYNVIPDKVTLKGTLRCTDSQVREDANKAIAEVLHGICGSYGATCSFKRFPGYDVTVNADSAYDVGMRVLAQVLPSKDQIVVLPDCMSASEDFSEFAKLVPSNYVGIGCYNAEKGCAAPNHNARFDVDEEAMKVGVKVHFGIIHELLMQ